MDVKTVLFFLILVNFFLGSLMLFFYRIQKTYPGFRSWAFSHVIVGISYILVGLRGVLPDYLSIVFANILIIPVGLFRIKGVSRFFGKNFSMWQRMLYFFLIFSISFFYFTYIEKSGAIRNLIFSFFVVYICIHIIVVYAKNRQQTSKAILSVTVAIFSFYSFIIGTRAVIWLLNPGEHFLFSGYFINSLFFSSLLILDIAWAVLFLMMNNNRLSTELRRNNQELKEINQIKDKFFAVLAHDLKNPIWAISGISHLLKDDIEKEDYQSVKESVYLLKDASEKIKILLENLLKWAKTQMGGISFNPVPLNLNQELEQSIREASAQTHKKNISLKNMVPENIFIKADRDMFQTVIRNLLSNAIKFSHPGSAIYIASEKRINQILLSIKDSGVGMELELIDNLFNPDNKNRKKGTQEEEGSGLGLSIAYEYIKIHQGEMWAESKLGQGSTFYSLWPRN